MLEGLCRNTPVFLEGNFLILEHEVSLGFVQCPPSVLIYKNRPLGSRRMPRAHDFPTVLLCQASTRARTRRGQDAECSIYQSAWFGNLSAYSWKIPLTVFIAPEHFRAFRRLRERADFPHRDFGPEQNLDAEMNFVTPSADCPHCFADIVRTSCLSSRLLRLPQTILEASALRTASRMFRTPSGKYADTAEDIRC